MKKKIVSVCLTAMLVGGLSMTSMQEARAAEGKVIDGSELTHEEESIGYDTKITRGEDLLTGYSKCTVFGEEHYICTATADMSGTEYSLSLIHI